jgi:hypothetical protein
MSTDTPPSDPRINTGLQWPPGHDRTPHGDRVDGRKFDTPVEETSDDLRAELARLGADSYHAETGSGGRHTDANGLPKASANPHDPGIALYWTHDGDDYGVGCDEYTTLAANIRAVYLWFRETRKRNARPVVTGSSGFAAAALPAGTPDTDQQASDTRNGPLDGRDPHDILGIQPDVDPLIVKAAAKKRKARYHPDGEDPDEAEFKAVQAAEQAMLDDLEDA